MASPIWHPPWRRALADAQRMSVLAERVADDRAMQTSRNAARSALNLGNPREMTVDLSHLVADCARCAAALTRPVRRRGQTVTFVDSGSTVRLGNCELCREVRLSLIEEWERLGCEPTDHLMGELYADYPNPSRSWRLSAVWWLAERRTAS